MSKPRRKHTTGAKVFSRNKRAYYDYEVLDSIEAGVSLRGGEVKSIKAGLASIKEGFIDIDAGEAWLWGVHIPKWRFSGESGYDPTRKRRLLLHKEQIGGLVGKTREKGMALIPLKLYGVGGKVKVEVGVCRGKKKHEKRHREKERQLKKELHKERRKYMV